MNYVNEYIKLSTAAEAELREIMEQHKEIVLFDDTEEDVTIYEANLPVISQVTKHGFYDEYAVTKLTRTEEGEIKLEAAAKGEGNDDVFGLSHITAEEVLYLADAVKEHLFNEEN